MLLVVGQCHVCVFTYAVIYTVVDLVSHGIVVVSVILLFMPTLITLHYWTNYFSMEKLQTSNHSVFAYYRSKYAPQLTIKNPLDVIFLSELTIWNHLKLLLH